MSRFSNEKNSLYFIETFSSVTVQSKAWVCGHSLAGIAGSNPVGGMGVRLLCLFCFVRGLEL